MLAPCLSDGISNGTKAMSYSLQSRDLIADQVETAAGGHWLDGMVAIPGCDKNMPATVMAAVRHNRPTIIVYGGTIQHGVRRVDCPALGHKKGDDMNVSDAFESYGTSSEGATK